jgi:succinate dehydrogenase / fumarate reductase, membrane anchor subunit
MVSQHRRGGGHARPVSRGFEAWAWLFMRVSGVALLFLAVFHLLWMHFVIGVDNLSFQTVVSRWSNPLWRIYDFALLGFALVHGVNGLRMVLEDYLHRPGTLLAVKSVAYVLAFVLLSAGAWIIFTFHVPA